MRERHEQAREFLKRQRSESQQKRPGGRSSTQVDEIRVRLKERFELDEKRINTIDVHAVVHRLESPPDGASADIYARLAADIIAHDDRPSTLVQLAAFAKSVISRPTHWQFASAVSHLTVRGYSLYGSFAIATNLEVFRLQDPTDGTELVVELQNGLAKVRIFADGGIVIGSAIIREQGSALAHEASVASLSDSLDAALSARPRRN
ncbi:MAG TPA: hypothetical protein VLC09_04265 [Polyangiaceae bacterium]|nr:hypothetical protein [Polyangiaceae bacterium]